MNSTQKAAPRQHRSWLPVTFVAGMLSTPLVGLAFALSGFMSIDAAGRPPNWESKIGQHALEVSLAKRSQDLVNPMEDTEADLIAGMNTYRNACAGCHGNYGQHRSGGGLYPPVPQFNQHPPWLTAPEMFVAVKYGIRYTGMGAWNGELADKDIWQTVGFLRHLSNLPAAVDKAWKSQHQ